VREPRLQGEDQVSKSVDREVVSLATRGNLRLPMKGEVHRGEAYR